MKNKKHHPHSSGEFHHKHSLGQNFLEDENLLEQLADLSGVTAEDMVLEIGPGLGALTKPLANRCKKIVSLEIDKTLLPILRVTLEHHSNAQVVCGDVMKTDLAELVAEHFEADAPIRVAANLPYYITTEVLTKLLFELPQAKSIAVMIQKEVGDKLMSKPGDEGYGPLAIMCQYFCDVRRALVPAECFTPPPKVDSSFMVLERREAPLYTINNERTFIKLIKGAFVMRRKTLVNNLMSAFAMSRECATTCVEQANLSTQVRAEAISIEQFACLSNVIDAAKE